MFPVALRTAAVVGGTTVLLGLSAVPSMATTGVSVTLSPAFAPVGTQIHVGAASGLANVTQVAFGASGFVARTGPGSDTDVQTTVPADATTGVLTLYYADTSTAPTQQSFSVQAPTSATIARSKRAVVFPHGAVVSAVLTAAGVPVSGQKGYLQRAVPHTNGWHRVRDVQVTSQQGRVHWLVAPHVSYAYRVHFRAVPAYLGTTTPRTRINVRPHITFAAPGIAPIYTRTKLHGRVRPVPDGRVILDRRDNGAWHRVQTTTPHKHGRFTFKVTMPTTGPHVYRVRRPHDSSHWRGLSKPQRIKAVERSLHSGMSGPDVRTLQRRLKHLHYDVGQVSGTYGFDTQHAVVAFEKVQEMSRDGVVGPRVWKRLNDPRVPHLRHPSSASSSGVEVDLVHQVLYYARNGHIVRILDSSTGGGYYYTGSDGTSQRAVTPTGHFSVVYMREGWVTSKLGTLYRPAYFNSDGYAIHGEGEVPSYPASHGCVRITVPARDRLGSKLYNGLSVWIY